MAKCYKCNKVVSKKSPGIQCSKCSKWMHGVCADISTEQLNALYAMESIDWKCKVCSSGSKQKRISCILPETDADTDNEISMPKSTVTDPTRKMLCEIKHEVREIIRDELQRTLQFYSDKIDEYEDKIKLYENNMKKIENQNRDLSNNLKHISLKFEAMEQKLNNIDIRAIEDQLEIANIKEVENESVEQIVKSVGDKWGVNSEDIVKVYRKQSARPGNAGKKPTPPIIVSLKEGRRNNWLEQAKKNPLTACDLDPEGDAKIKIYLRESLTSWSASLLWKAKQELKESKLCKFVWYKNGVILARRHEDDKPKYIRSIHDIDRLVAEFAE